MKNGPAAPGRDSAAPPPQATTACAGRSPPQADGNFTDNWTGSCSAGSTRRSSARVLIPCSGGRTRPWPGRGRVTGQHAVELAAGGDAELGEHLAQVVLGRAGADEQP